MTETKSRIIEFPGKQVTLTEMFRSTGTFVNGHKANALFFNCCDYRFRKGDEQFMGSMEDNLLDLFNFPGGVMLFVGHKYGHPDMCEGTLHWAELLSEAHKTDKNYVVVHGRNLGKCGAYALSKGLEGKSGDELFEFQVEDALAIQEMLETRTGKPVELLYKEAAEDGSSDIVYSKMTVMVVEAEEVLAA